MSKLSPWNIFWGFLVTFQDIFVKLCPKILSQKVWRSSFCRTNPAEAGMSKWREWKLNICFSSSAEGIWSGAQVRAGEFRTSGGSGNLFDSFLSHSFFFVPCYSLFIVCLLLSVIDSFCSGDREGRGQCGLDGGKLSADMELAEAAKPGEEIQK